MQLGNGGIYITRAVVRASKGKVAKRADLGFCLEENGISRQL